MSSSIHEMGSEYSKKSPGSHINIFICLANIKYLWLLRKGVKCRLTSTSLILEGRKEILLEILEKLGHAPFRTEGKKFAITLDFGQSNKLIPIKGKLEFQGVDKEEVIGNKIER